MQFNAVVNMAENKVLVNISGPALSLLLYENARSTGDQIGLLLGNVMTFIRKKVTDCERHVELTEKHINIDSVMVCSKDILENAIGGINTNKMEAMLKNKEKHVVGWFRFRRHNFLQPTMKDKIMHKEFTSHFLRCAHMPEELFIMFILNASVTKQLGTHKYRHVCVQYYREVYRPVPLRINNLGDDVTCLGGSDYKSVPDRRLKETDVFTKLVQDLKLNPNNTSSVEMVSCIEKQAEKYLRDLISSVCKSDEEISRLQKQVVDLRAKIQMNNWKRNSLQKEKSIESQHNVEGEKIFTTAQVHGSPHSTHSEDLFDSEPLPNVTSSNSTYSNSLLHKKSNSERTKQSIVVRDTRNNSSSESNYCENIGNDESPESSRSKERTTRSMNRSFLEEKSLLTKKQTNSPKSSMRKSERHSFGDFSSHSQEETSPHGRKDQTP